MQEYEEESGISLGDIFRIIFSQKWLALILAVLISVAGTCGMYFIGRTAGDYVLDFTVYLPRFSINGSANSPSGAESSISYPDGSRFYYVDYASSRALNAVAKNYENINEDTVNSMIRDGVVFRENYTSIEVSNVNSAQSPTSVLRRTFEIRIGAQFFSNEENARNFLVDLSRYPIDLYSHMNINYNKFLDKNDFDNALEFETQIEYIKNQIDYINELYGSLSEVTDADGNLISSKRQQFIAWEERIDLQSLSTEAQTNYYLKDYQTSLEKFRNELVILNNDLADAEENLRNLPEYIREIGAQATDVAAVVAQLQARVTSLNRQKTIYEEYEKRYTQGDVAAHIAATQAYAQKLQDIYDQLTGENGYIAAYSDACRVVYEKQATVSYLNPNIIILENEDMSLLKSLVISVVAGVIIALVVAFIVGWFVGRKKVAVSAAKLPEKTAEAENAEKTE